MVFTFPSEPSSGGKFFQAENIFGRSTIFL